MDHFRCFGAGEEDGETTKPRDILWSGKLHLRILLRYDKMELRSV